MVGKYISGKRLCEEKKLTPLDLFTMVVKTGLQPYDLVGQPIPPPDIGWCEKVLQETVANNKPAEYWWIGLNIVGPLIPLFWSSSAEAFEKATGIRLFSPFEYMEHLKRDLGDELKSWRGYSFDRCPVRPTLDGKKEIFGLLVDANTIYLRLEVERALKGTPAKGRAVSPMTKHDRHARKQARWYAKQEWNVKSRKITKAALAKEIIEWPQMPKKYMPPGDQTAPKKYSLSKVQRWIADLNPNRSEGRRDGEYE